MRSNREIAAEALRRAGSIRAARLRRRQLVLTSAAGITSLCLIMVAALGMDGLLRALPRREGLRGSLGATFLQSDALGYVVVGVLAFVLGVAVALVAFLLKKRSVTGGRDVGA